MSHYKPYPAYKDSGVEWIGRVPEHWSIVPLKVLAQVINGATPESGTPAYWDGDIAWFTPADLNNENATELVEPRRRITADGLASCAARLTPAGSVVLSTRAPVGSVGVTRTPSATNQGCRTLVPAPGVPPNFLAQTLVAARSELALRSNGTTFQELSTDSLSSLRLPLPPPAEQTIITAALDRETARIDALIAKKTRFIELLKEKRQALITHAVTKGLDPTVKMKNSGVEWIGRVPEHWSIVPLKVLAQVINGATPESGTPAYWDGDIAWFTPADLNNENATELVEPRRRITADGLASCAARLTPAGSVVLSTRAPVGSVGVTRTPSATNQGCRTLVPAPGVPPNFLAQTLVAARSELALRSNGTTFQELSTDSLSSLRLPLPPPAEQTIITAALDRETARIDALIAKVECSITLLKERRSALITAAVTGQIDLREVV